MKIGIISDVHARPEPLQQALDIFAQEQVDEVICAGDIAGYYDSLEQTIDLLEQSNCKTIVGNHDQSFIEKEPHEKSSAIDYLTSLPATLNLTIEGKSIYVVHAEPPAAQHGGIKLLDQQGDIIPAQQQHWDKTLKGFDHDILIVGHTHQVYALSLGGVFVINPGSTAFNHSCMVLDLPDMTVQTYALEQKEIIKCWNFSMLYTSANVYPTATHNP